MKKPAPIRRRPRKSVEVDVQLLTKQFGGGAKARQVDEHQWLRGTAVRGGLRFWWRALNCHRFDSAAEMRAREDVLFGSPASSARSGPGKVDVVVRSCGPEKVRTAEWDPPFGEPLSIAYFPAQGMGQAAADLVEPGPDATIRLIGDLTESEWGEVKQAFACLVTLGGAGARTRRGAGALGFTDRASADAVDAPYDAASLRAFLTALPTGTPRFDAFALGARATYIAGASSPDVFRDGEHAQRHLLAMWRGFRQDRRHPRNWQGRNGWGRSQWPEPDAIRLAASKHARWEDGTDHAPARANAGKAPRAHLGLPIVFKFKDGPGGGGPLPGDHRERGRYLAADPDKTEMRPAGETGRYGSPVWLSVVGLEEGCAAVVVVTPSILRDKPRLTNPDGQELDPGPWEDVRGRLVAHLQNEGFQQVTGATP